MAIALVAERGTSTSTAAASTTGTLTVSGTTTAGNHLILLVCARGYSASNITVADTKSNTWQCDRVCGETNLNTGMWIASCKIATPLVTSDVITVTFPVTCGPSRVMILEEFSGLDTTTWLDKTATATNEVDVNATATTAATTQAAELVIGSFCTNPVSTTFSLGSGYTGFTAGNQSTSGAANGDRLVFGEYKIVAATGTQTATATMSNFTPGASSTGVATYKAALGSSPVNSVLPAVTGSVRVGAVLTTTTGTWLNTPTSYTYQWQRDAAGNGTFSNIGSATASTYTTVSADGGNYVRCVVTAVNASGSTPANSNGTGIVLVPPLNFPTVSSGDHVLAGYTLSTPGFLSFVSQAGKAHAQRLRYIGWTPFDWAAELSAAESNGFNLEASWLTSNYDDGLGQWVEQKTPYQVQSGLADGPIMTAAAALSLATRPVTLRFCWEMNGYYWPHSSCDSDGTPRANHDPSNYIAMWQRVRIIFWGPDLATINKNLAAIGQASLQVAFTASAPNVRFSWCPNLESNPANLTNLNTDTALEYYPGDDFVDIVAVDVYDAASSNSDWAGYRKPLLDSHYGLHTAVPFQLGEWGLLSGTDDSTFITDMGTWLAANSRTELIQYYDSGPGQLSGGANPNAFTAYKALIQNAHYLSSWPAYLPTASGNVYVGGVVSAATGNWKSVDTLSYAYQWQSSADGSTGWADLSGKTSSTYTVLVGVQGQYLRCTVTPTNAAGSTVSHTTVVGPVGAAPATSGSASGGTNMPTAFLINQS